VNPDEGAQDWEDAQNLYRLLEEEIVPRYYDRDELGLPKAWIGTMKQSIASTIWRFSATRMLQEYVSLLYLPAAAGTASSPVLAPAGGSAARGVAAGSATGGI
jgi:starch phosphorylase